VAALIEVGEDSRGVMMLFSEVKEAFNEDHLKLVSAAASQLANSMNNAELYSLIRDQAERLGQMLGHEQRESTKNTAIFDAIVDGVMYANEHGTVVLFNSAAERILGLPAERVVNRSITELTGLYGGSSGTWMSAMENWMNNPVSRAGDDFVEELLELEDGRIVSVRLSPVSMGDQFLGTVSVFRDMTRIVEVDRMKSEFVSTVSHELRTPMTSIKGYADLLLLGAAGEITEAQQRFLETIKQNADRLSILVNDLLEVSRIDQDRIPMRFMPIQVSDLLQNIEAHLQGRIADGSRHLTVIMQASDDIPLIRADYDRMIKIMQNLADNAYNYTPDNGEITLGATYQAGDKTVQLFIRDTGIGIPESIQGRVFERFFRGDEYDELVMDTPGTGLGLSIVQSLIEMHDGEIWFESQQGVGTTFYVKIPVADEQTSREA
jgi:PAS domain S-box-containing protein